MDFKSLKVFKAVVETGSVSRAASALHYVQSNVTARIQRLEEDVGAQLFVRSRQGMTLTPAGEVLLRYAERSLRLVDEARAAVSAAQGLGGILRLGSLEATLASRLSGPLASFHRSHGDVDLEITTGTTDQLVQAVLEFKLDAALIGGKVAHPAIERRTAFTEEVVLVTSPDVEDMLSWTTRTVIVFRQGCAYRALAEQWLRGQGIAPVRLMELGTLDGMMACVGAGLGVALLPRSALEAHRLSDNVRLHALGARHATLEINLIRHREAPQHPALESFYALLGDGTAHEGASPAPVP